MLSLIIASSDKTKRQEYIQKYLANLAVDPFDITLIEKDTSGKKNVNSIGIEDVTNMQKKLYLKPLRSETKAVIVEDAQFLTPQAQNALLKILEEPPAHTLIILSTDTKEAFLPTILSRCKVIELKDEKMILSDTQNQELSEFLLGLSEMSTGERLKKAEDLAKDKEKAIIWITNLILLQRDNLLKQISTETRGTRGTLDTHGTFMIDTLKKLQSLFTILKTTNVNPRFAIENTLLAL